MGATFRTIAFTISVWDYDHIVQHNPRLAELINRTPYSSDDWVVNELREVMLVAGKEWLNKHPDLCRAELM
jgi:hypothetical protein